MYLEFSSLGQAMFLQIFVNVSLSMYGGRDDNTVEVNNNEIIARKMRILINVIYSYQLINRL